MLGTACCNMFWETLISTNYLILFTIKEYMMSSKRLTYEHVKNYIEGFRYKLISNTYKTAQINLLVLKRREPFLSIPYLLIIIRILK